MARVGFLALAFGSCSRGRLDVWVSQFGIFSEAIAEGVRRASSKG